MIRFPRLFQLLRKFGVQDAGSGGRRIFYVDQTGGNDANPGLSTTQAWKTLAKVESFIGFTPGNRILFKAGETWNEDLELVAGRHDNLYFGRYGSGANPIIHGQDTRPTGIQARYVTGLTIENINVKNSTVTNIEFGETGVHTCRNVSVQDSGDQNFAVSATAVVRLYDCLISGAVDDGISIHNSGHVEVYNSIISGNGQGINASTGGGTPYLKLDGCTLEENINDNINLDFGGQDRVILWRSLFRHCTGGNNNCSVVGGALVEYCTWDVYSGINSARTIGTTGGVINMRNCSVIGNNTGDMLIFTGDTYNLVNCICYDLFRMSNAFGGDFNVDYSDLYSVSTKVLTVETNIVNGNGNPNLVDPANDDFRLSANLTGTTYAGQLSTDFAGNPVADPPSLGALEYVA